MNISKTIVFNEKKDFLNVFKKNKINNKMKNKNISIKLTIIYQYCHQFLQIGFVTN